MYCRGSRSRQKKIDGRHGSARIAGLQSCIACYFLTLKIEKKKEGSEGLFGGAIVAPVADVDIDGP